MFKRRLKIIILTLTTIATILLMNLSVSANNYNGGWAKTYATQSIYSNYWGGTQIGTIYQNEGLTVLNTYSNYSYVEYSTSNGTKRGYVLNAVYNTDYLNKTCVAKVNSYSNVYGGPVSDYRLSIGSLYSGELVSVLAKQDGWSYVEYNTTSGRKRGFIESYKISTYNEPSTIERFYHNINSGSSITVGYNNVYAGPSNQYALIGSVSNEVIKWHRYVSDGSADGGYFYISYNITGTNLVKYGYIYIRGY